MDAYIVIKHPCCGARLGVFVFSEGESFMPSSGVTICADCRAVFCTWEISPLLVLDGKHADLNTWPKHWLRKLPPFTDEQDIETQQRKPVPETEEIK